MKSSGIELGLGDAIECWGFIRSIAKATHPSLENAEGIDCVIGKIVNHSNVDEHFHLPYGLTDDDRAQLEPLLEHLPKIHGKMTDLEIDTFLSLYSALPSRLSWVPRLNTKADIDRIESEQWDIQAEHRQQLQQRLQDGKIQAFDSHHIPAKRIGPNVYIPRKQATSYLLECGIEICSAVDSKNLFEIEQMCLNELLQPDANDGSADAKISPLKFSQQSNNRPPTVATAKDLSPIGQQSPAGSAVELAAVEDISAEECARRSLGQANENNHVSHKRPRTDALSRAIVMAQSKCSDPLDKLAVWDALKKMAKNKVPPLVSADDISLTWEFAEGRTSEFKRNSLRMRLYRQR